MRVSRSLLLPAALLGVVLVSTADASRAACTTATWGGTVYASSIGFTIVGMSVNQVNQSISYWETGCLSQSSGNGFPRMTTLSPFSRDFTVKITYHQGDSNSVCGRYTKVGNTRTIELWDFGETSSGVSYKCNPTDTLAHEMGHVLGLNNSSCSGGLMGSAPVWMQNGQLTAQTRSVSSTECTVVDWSWQTEIEETDNDNDGGGPCGV